MYVTILYVYYRNTVPILVDHHSPPELQISGVLKDLEIGQELNTKVVRKTRNGLRLDWKGKEASENP